MVSKHLHCLNDLLFRASTGSLQIETMAIVSNHPDAAPLARSYGIDFHHIPVTADTKADAEKRLMELVEGTGTHLVVLARYMQVLSDDLCRQLSGRAINIHHSFLPSFKGAAPYTQAHARGVKLIGATAHYVTADLDEGPIIEQDVTRADHTMNPDDLMAAGRDVECSVLARAVRFHIDGACSSTATAPSCSGKLLHFPHAEVRAEGAPRSTQYELEHPSRLAALAP
jgi:formyltetrahydrofolate deformylase